MNGLTLTESDREIYRKQLSDFLPQTIIDAHAHIWRSEFGPRTATYGTKWPGRVASQCTAEELILLYEILFPCKKVMPVFMGHPEATPLETNAYAKTCGEKYGLPTLYCTSYDTSAAEIRLAIAQGGFIGIKPYPNRAPKYIPPHEIRIFDYLPHEHLRVLDELGAVAVLHIPRPYRLRDEVNIAQLMNIDNEYPNAKIVVAHIGRAYIEEDLGNAFDTLKHSKNLLFDISANTLDIAMSECIKAVGPQRVLFGSDMPITKMRMYRVSENGVYKNVVPRGMYGEVSDDKNMKESDEKNITFFIYEEILALKRAVQIVGLGKNEVSDIFYGNAVRTFNI